MNHKLNTKPYDYYSHYKARRIREESAVSKMPQAAVCSAVSSRGGEMLVRNSPREAVREISNMIDISCLAKQILIVCGNCENLAQPDQSIIQ